MNTFYKSHAEWVRRLATALSENERNILTEGISILNKKLGDFDSLNMKGHAHD